MFWFSTRIQQGKGNTRLPDENGVSRAQYINCKIILLNVENSLNK